jgi:hypothetical protein
LLPRVARESDAIPAEDVLHETGAIKAGNRGVPTVGIASAQIPFGRSEDAGGAVYVPYPVVVDPDQADAAPEPNPNTEDDYRGGPTIFDRRGPGQPARPYVAPYSQSANRAQAETESAAAQPAETPVADQPETVLVFKDGHKVEVQNYAVVGDVLYDLTPGHHRKIPITDLDLNATAKQNDDLGVNFQLPPGSETTK